MIKMVIIGVLLYAAYRIYIPKSLNSSEKEKLREKDEGYTDYEEID